MEVDAKGSGRRRPQPARCQQTARRPQPAHRLQTARRRTAATLALAVSLGSVGATAVSPASPAGAATRPPDLQGTWEGPYSYPSPDGVVRPSYQKLVIERQEGVHLWGYDEFLDKDGQTIRIPVLGTVSGREIGLAEKGGFFTGRLVSRNRMSMRFFLVGDRPTSFATVLTRRSS